MRFIVLWIITPVFTIAQQHVGIGTTTPEARLHVRSSQWIKAIFENDAGQPRGYIGTDNNGTVTLAANAYWTGSAWSYPGSGSSMYMLMHKANNRFEFRVRPDGGSENIVMVITTGANVGIGTTNPSAKLEIAAQDPAVHLRNVNDGGGAVLVNSYGTLELGMYNPGANTWNQVPAGGRRFFFGLNTEGKVGSLTNTGLQPVFRNLLDDGTGGLQVKGSGEVDGNLRVNGQIGAGGSPGGESLRVYGAIHQDQDENGPGFFTLASNRTNGPEIQLLNTSLNGKTYTYRNVGTGASSALSWYNFTDSREVLRVSRVGYGTFGSGIKANGLITADGLEIDNGSVLIGLKTFTPYISLNAGATGTSPAFKVFTDGYGSGVSIAADFTPDIVVSRNVMATAFMAGVKLFRIDHPLDPLNKNLQHASIESDQMVNLYRGNITLDPAGKAIVTMPGWFEEINADFAYVLTPIGGWAPLYIEKEINTNTFSIAGGQPGMKVSWQVTAIRKDEFALMRPLVVEPDKEPHQKGKKLYTYSKAGLQLQPVQ